MYGKGTLNFIRNCRTVSIVAVLFAIFENFICSASSLPFGIVIFKSSNRHIVVFHCKLIGISLKISHVEHLFMCLFIHISSLVKCLSIYFSIFKIRLFSFLSLFIFNTSLLRRVNPGPMGLGRCWCFCDP